MSVGHFAGSFLQAFTQARTAGAQKKLDEDEKKARLKLYEIQLERATKQDTAQTELLDLMKGGSPEPVQPPQDGIGPVRGAQQPMSLTELLADPKTAMLMLQSGMVDAGDLLKANAPAQEPDSIRTLRALAGDPALMEAELKRRSAGAASTTVNLDSQGLTKPPPGYFRPDPQKPGLEVEPGGPQEREITATASEALKAVEGTEASLEQLAAAAKMIKENPSLWRATGPLGAMKSAPGFAAADLDVDIKSLSSKVAFGTLSAMRETSKTGGALGSVSERELDLLQNNIAALDQKQSTAAFKKNLQVIIDYTATSRQRLREAYKRTYGGKVIDESGASGGASNAKIIDFKDLPP